MPKFRSEAVPPWCELEAYHIMQLLPGQSQQIHRIGRRENIVATRGACSISDGRETRTAREGEWIDIGAMAGETITCRVESGPATLVHMSGRWGDGVGPCGVFDLLNSGAPRNDGDPAPYPRETEFDNHYHDCDEYWIITEGECVAVSEGVTYILVPGDCLATRAGDHHDLPIVLQPVRGIYFEGTLRGRRRLGHLWEHRDGPARAPVTTPI
jgi:mannose-6-phosphate isomerase-like protein (cupin superfamily)